MKLRSILLIAFSLVLGVFALALVNKRGQSAPPPSVQIVAAKVRLNFGDHVKPESLRVMNFPPDTVLEGAFAKIEEIAGPGEDRVVLRAMAPGEPVLATKISGTGGKATLSTVVEKGMRAMTIRVNDVTGGGGFVLPQDRVDVMLTRTGQANDTKQTIVLLQNVKVLGIDQQADDKKDKPIVAKAVTLEVTPDDAQKLTLGSSIGSLSLLLRNYANPDAAPTGVLSLDDLFAPKPTPAVAGKPEVVQADKAAAAPTRKIEIMRGTDPTSYDVNKDGSVGPDNSNAKMTIPKPAMPKPAKLGARQQTAEKVSD
jgi:pilus assembly protein CpaB